jgi:hypothetical protein
MRYVALVVLLSVVACESTSDQMKSWVGSSDTAVMAQWGAPDLESRGSDGSRVLTYNGKNGYGQTICRMTFTVDPSGKVSRWQHNCPM